MLKSTLFCKTVHLPSIFLLLSLFWQAPADATTLRACSQAQLDSAIVLAWPGDVIEMCDKKWTDTVIDFNVKGTSNAPITLRGQSPGGVVLAGSSRLFIGGSHAIVDGLTFRGRYTGAENSVIEFQSKSGKLCSDCRLTNLSMINYNPSSSDMLTRWVVLHGKRNRIDHSHFKGKNNLGAMIQLRRGADQSPNEHRIDHNLLEDRPNFTGEGNQNGDTLEIGETGKYAWGKSGSTIEFNYLRNIDSDFEVVTLKSSGNTLQYNVVESSRGVISLRVGDENVVRGNYVFGRGKEGTGGIRVRGKRHTISSNYIYNINPENIQILSGIVLSDGTNEVMPADGENARDYLKFERADNVRVLNNTIIEAGTSIAFLDVSPMRPQNIEVANNIYVQDSGDAVAAAGMGSNVRFNNNLFAGQSAGVSGGIRHADPMLEVDHAGIMRPRPASPAIDAGIAESSDAVDMDGQARQNPFDIGADELVAGEDPRGAVRLCDVGPTTYRIGLPSACDNVVASSPRPMPPQLISVQ